MVASEEFGRGLFHANDACRTRFIPRSGRLLHFLPHVQLDETDDGTWVLTSKIRVEGKTLVDAVDAVVQLCLPLPSQSRQELQSSALRAVLVSSVN